MQEGKVAQEEVGTGERSMYESIREEERQLQRVSLINIFLTGTVKKGQVSQIKGKGQEKKDSRMKEEDKTKTEWLKEKDP